jgi:hypothetical protein
MVTAIRGPVKDTGKGGGWKPVSGPEVLASLKIIRAFFWYR